MCGKSSLLAGMHSWCCTLCCFFTRLNSLKVVSLCGTDPTLKHASLRVCRHPVTTFGSVIKALEYRSEGCDVQSRDCQTATVGCLSKTHLLPLPSGSMKVSIRLFNSKISRWVKMWKRAVLLLGTESLLSPFLFIPKSCFLTLLVPPLVWLFYGLTYLVMQCFYFSRRSERNCSRNIQSWLPCAPVLGLGLEWNPAVTAALCR